MIRNIVADLDGVVYRGDTAIPTAVQAFSRWRAAGVPVCFVTNNATRTPAEVAAKLTRLGVPTDATHVVTSPIATAAYVQRTFPPARTAFVVGAPALQQALIDVGCLITDHDPAIVVVGLDRAFTYEKLRIAVRAILAGGTLIGTNPDLLVPTDDGFEPGAGTLLAAITSATGAEPIMIGKPQPSMIELALERLGASREGTVMIGDQLATDIAAGRAAGMRTILVTTGVPAKPCGIIPDQTVASLLKLFP